MASSSDKSHETLVYGVMDRRSWLKAAGAAAIGVGLPGCASSDFDNQLVRPRTTFVIPRVSWDRVIRTVVGIRPVRDPGWRVEVERFGDKIVVHNYGHGARGIGMSWGTAHQAAELIQPAGHRSYAVVGCGAVGLATAHLLQRRGFEVTIYAKDLPPNTTSNAAGAMFDVEPVLGDSDSGWARVSHRYFQDLVGDYYGVRWIEGYATETEERRRDREQNDLADLYHYEVIPAGEHPFGPFDVARDITMQIQPQIYLNAVMRDFLLAGGEIVVREFSDLESFLSLTEPVIVNCTGLGAKALFDDDDLYPSKGQYTMMLPEPEMDYRGWWATPRDDGLMITGAGGGEPNVTTLEPNDELMQSSVNRAIEFWDGVRSRIG